MVSASRKSISRCWCFSRKDRLIDRDRVLRKLVDIQYQRNDYDFHRGTFRVRGDTVEVFPAYEENPRRAHRVLRRPGRSDYEIDPLRGKVISQAAERGDLSGVALRDDLGSHGRRRWRIFATELRERLEYFRTENRLLEAQRLEQRTLYDLELLAEMGFCPGIENYSRHLTGRRQDSRRRRCSNISPRTFSASSMRATLRFRRSAGCIAAIARARARWSIMGSGCPRRWTTGRSISRNGKGFARQAVYVSATPGDYELRKSGGLVVEQLIRPTGLIDPEIEVRRAGTQVDDLLEEIRKRVDANERVLATCLTKKMAEDLTDYYHDLGVRVRYLHSDIETIERVEIIRSLRKGDFDVLVGINLLREGLDLPEVSLVAILDADKEGYLRSARSLIQTIGRAARNLNGKVIMYADTDHQFDANGD